MNATVKKKAAPKKRATTKKLATVEKKEIAPAQQPNQISPLEQMKQMHEMGYTVEDAKSMLALQKEYEANEALKAFNRALAAFKSENVTVYKRGKVGYENNDGSETGYTHAKLEDIVDIVTPILSKHGFSTRWRTEQSDKGMTRVIFVLTHELGHSEETSLQAGLDQSGGKNNIQALGSTVSYLERYTFLAGTGIAVKEIDDDGAGADAPIDYITADQLANLEALIEEVGADETQFLLFLKVDCLENLPESKFHGAVRALEGKR